MIERNLLGGDCLNVGCVPSKGIIRAARAAHDALNCTEFGVQFAAQPNIGFAAAMERMRKLRAGISDHDSVSNHSTELGVDVFIGEGRFVDRARFRSTASGWKFDRAVIATGAAGGGTVIVGLRDAGLARMKQLPP